VYLGRAALIVNDMGMEACWGDDPRYAKGMPKAYL
jgi:hypothetical protein